MKGVGQSLFPQYKVPSAGAPDEGASGVSAEGMPNRVGLKSQ